MIQQVNVCLNSRRNAAAMLLIVASLVANVVSCESANADELVPATPPTITVKHCDDFKVNGIGDAAAWGMTEWVSLSRRPDGKHDYMARFKMLYSDSGVYVLFDGSDKILTATMQEDFLDLWNEDVYECFFWTDEKHPLYFEYEISPLGYELPILIPNLDGQFLGWRPWHYEADKKTQKQVSATGGEVASMASVASCAPRCSFPTSCCNRSATYRPNQEPVGERISIESTTTMTSTPAGTGPGLAPVFTNSRNSEP